MACEWRETTLGAEVELLTGFPFRSERYTRDEKGIRLLRGDNIAQGSLRWEGVKCWPADEYSEHEPYQLQSGDVVLAMDRPWIEAGLKFAAVTRFDLPALLVQRVARLRGGPALDTKFLRYLIASQAFTHHILAVQTGTAVPHISGSQIKDFRFLCPTLSEQHAIAHILGTLDDKIELNRRMNETLEAMARALFKSWFVDFDPVRAKLEGRKPAGMDKATAALFPDSFQDSPLGKIPTGWEATKLGNVIAIYDSKRIPLSSRERSTRKGPYPYYGAASAMDYVDGYLFDGTYVLVGEDGSVVNDDDTPVVQYVWGKFWVNNHAHVLRGKGSVCVEHLMLHLRQCNVRPHVTGAVQPKLNQENLKRIDFIDPPENICRAFAAIVSVLYDALRAGADQTRSLAALRDALLPKLLSGEIRVKDAEKLVEAKA